MGPSEERRLLTSGGKDIAPGCASKARLVSRFSSPKITSGSDFLSDSWTQFTLLEEKPPDGYMWSGWRLTRRQLTSRPDHL